jgi:hypothetical protein
MFEKEIILKEQLGVRCLSSVARLENCDQRWQVG